MRITAHESQSSFAEFERQLVGLPEAVQVAIRDATTTLRNLAIGGTPVGRPGVVHSGTLKRSWSGIDMESAGFSFSNPQDYASTIEEGGYTRVGPRTVAVGGKIYSKQAVGGILAPLVEEDALNKTVTQIAKVIGEELAK